MKRLYILLIFLSFYSFSQERKQSVITQNQIFVVSYNEQYEQPNWFEYTVKNLPKRASRKGLNFYNVDSIWTSNNADYKNNIWDKGHLAPAASFADSKLNLKATFSFLNCALQHNKLNRKEWKELEEQVREWAKEYGDIKIRVEVYFDPDHLILPTGAHVPSSFLKQITFPNGSVKCFYFLNQDTLEKDWKDYETKC